MPEKEQRIRGDLTRYRIKLVQQRAQVVNRLAESKLEGTGYQALPGGEQHRRRLGTGYADALIGGETDSARWLSWPADG
ncbi:MAG: hypothetical protein R2854_01400 [Caldilineaceae bacterium]